MVSAETRRVALGIALSLTVAAIIIDPDPGAAREISTVKTVRQSREVPAVPAMAQPLEEDALADPFKSHGWQVSQPPAAQPVAPLSEPVQKAAAEQDAEPPHAPPLPFKYAGRFSDDGSAVVYLTRGDQTIVAKTGDSVDSDYKILELTADRIEFQHVPTGERQALTIPTNE